MRTKGLPIFTLAAAAIALCGQAHADLSFTLDQSSPAVAAGQTFSFLALLQNTDAGNTLSLDGSSITLNSPLLTANDNFLSTPLGLNPKGQAGDSWHGDLFDITVASNAAPNSVLTGSYDVLYTPAGSFPQTATENFSITVTAPVPEAGTLLGFGVLILGAGLTAARKRGSRPVANS